MTDDRVVEILELHAAAQGDFIGLLGKMIEAIHDANDRIDALEQRLAALEKRGQPRRPQRKP
jgi:hypothetical protein